MILVPERNAASKSDETVETLKHIQQLLEGKTSPSTLQSYRLDDVIEAILSQTDLTEDEKAKHYAQAVQRQRMFQKQNRLDDTPRDVQADAEIPLVETIIGSVPKTFQAKAERLVRFLKDQRIKWLPSGELIDIDGHSIPNTHIVDLINDLVRERKKVRPNGREALARQLSKTNMPRELVGNEERWRTITNIAVNEVTSNASSKVRKRRNSSDAEHLYGLPRWEKH